MVSSSHAAAPAAARTITRKIHGEPASSTHTSTGIATIDVARRFHAVLSRALVAGPGIVMVSATAPPTLRLRRTYACAPGTRKRRDTDQTLRNRARASA